MEQRKKFETQSERMLYNLEEENFALKYENDKIKNELTEKEVVFKATQKNLDQIQAVLNMVREQNDISLVDI